MLLNQLAELELDLESSRSNLRAGVNNDATGVTNPSCAQTLNGGSSSPSQKEALRTDLSKGLGQHNEGSSSVNNKSGVLLDQVAVGISKGCEDVLNFMREEDPDIKAAKDAWKKFKSIFKRGDREQGIAEKKEIDGQGGAKV